MDAFLLQNVKLIILFMLIGSLVGLSRLGERLSRPSRVESQS